MAQTYLLGIDVGTTATKAVLIDPEGGRLVAQAERPSALSAPQAGWAEEDPEGWWANVCALVPECLAQANAEAGQVAAVGVSGMVPAVVLLDEAGQVLRPSIQQNDVRAIAEIDYFRYHTAAEDVLRRTGSAVTQQSVGPKLRWLREHEPETLSRVAQVMGSYDFIVRRLTGEASIERNWALESGLYDLEREDWDETLLDLATVSGDQLGAVRQPAEFVGGVSDEAAQATGLRAGTPVVAGSADHVASAFSAGLKAPGDLLVKLGGSGDILVCLDEVLVDERLYLDYHVIPGKYLVNGCMAASGSLIRWFRDEFAPGEDLAALDREAATVLAGSDGLILLPYFLGEKTPLNDPLARGTLVGLTLSHTRAHVYRAVLEGIAYGFYHHLQVLAERGLTATTARVTNGGARSGLWKQITADVLGLRLEQVARHPGSSLGAAFVAGMGVGAFRDWNEIERYIEVSTIVQPDARNHERYRKMFGIYREIYEALKNTYPKLQGNLGN